MLPSKWANLVPIPSAFGLPFYLGPNYAVTMGLGSVIKYIWERNDPTGAQLFVIPGALARSRVPPDVPGQSFFALFLFSSWLRAWDYSIPCPVPAAPKTEILGGCI